MGERAIEIGEQVGDGALFFIELVVVDVDEVLGFFHVQLEERFGHGVARPVLNVILVGVEVRKESLDVLVVGEEDGDVDVPVPRDDAAVTVGAQAGTAIDPPNDVVSIEDFRNFFECFDLDLLSFEEVGGAFVSLARDVFVGVEGSNSLFNISFEVGFDESGSLGTFNLSVSSSDLWREVGESLKSSS